MIKSQYRKSGFVFGGSLNVRPLLRAFWSLLRACIARACWPSSETHTVALLTRIQSIHKKLFLSHLDVEKRSKKMERKTSKLAERVVTMVPKRLFIGSAFVAYSWSLRPTRTDWWFEKMATFQGRHSSTWRCRTTSGRATWHQHAREFRLF